MREVTDEMNIKGIRTKLGGKISVNSVTRMLLNRKYIGEYKYRDIVKPNEIPALVRILTQWLHHSEYSKGNYLWILNFFV